MQRRFSVGSDDVRQETTISADGTQIAWYDLGGVGPDLLLAHATGFCGLMWMPVVDYLKKSFHCVAYDVRGHGASGRPPRADESDEIDLQQAWDWHRYADDAIAVTKAAELVSPCGVGHSGGGATELLVEQRQPGTFTALVLFEPVVFAADPPTGPDPQRDLAVRSRKRRAVFPSRPEALANFREKGPFRHLVPAALEAYVDHGFAALPSGEVELRCRPDDEAEVYVMASAHDAYQHLAEVRCPVSVVRGATSGAFSSDEMRAVVDRLPEARFLELEGIGHFGPLENPAQFAEVVVQSFPATDA